MRVDPALGAEMEKRTRRRMLKMGGPLAYLVKKGRA